VSLPGKRAGMIIHERQPLNAETPRYALLEGLLTGTDAFYVRSHGPIPELDLSAWRLEVGGLVAEPLRMSLADLQADFPHRELVATLQCAGNRRADLMAVREIPGEAPWGPGATGTARWTGAALADVLAAAGLRDEAAFIEFIGADVSEEASPPQSFGGSISRRKAMAGEVLLVWAMNGRPVPALHGAPVRVVVPGYIGARSVKWLTRIVARESPSENYFQASTYRLLPAEAGGEVGVARAGLALGAVAVNSDILAPADGSVVPAGRVEVSGYAFAGDDRYVARVEVSTTSGRSWQQAEFTDEASRWAWRRWRAELELEPGEVELVARAWDSAAATQPADPAQLWNPKGYANSAWARARVRVSG
jgi:sulfite oxidase